MKTFAMDLESPRKTETPSKLRTKDFMEHLLRILAAFSALAVLALFAGFLLMLRVGHWLVKQDNLQKADAISVLSGGFPARALEASALYRAGYAREIWLTKPGPESPILKEMGIHYPNEADFNYRVLVRQGVPAKSIHILDDPIGNTADEVAVISDELQDKGEKTVIIVTEKAHTRRVRMLWTRLEGPHGTAIVRAVSSDEFDPNRWWNHTEDTQQVLHEVISLANLWAGMPVRTRVHEQASVAGKENSAPVFSHVPARVGDPVEEE